LRSKVILWLVIGGAVALSSGCGSSSRTHSGSSSIATPAESAALAAYIARGDRVCREGDEAIAPLNARGAAIAERHGATARQTRLMVPVLRQGLRQYRRFYRRLERIPPPPQDRGTVEQILLGLRRVGDDLERLTKALQRGERGAVRTITAEREMDHARVSALELEFGFKVCGQLSSRSSVAG
jgi:hypothetical protein